MTTLHIDERLFRKYNKLINSGLFPDDSFNYHKVIECSFVYISFLESFRGTEIGTIELLHILNRIRHYFFICYDTNWQPCEIQEMVSQKVADFSDNRLDFLDYLYCRQSQLQYQISSLNRMNEFQQGGSQ